ncbi:hypothetical protein E8E13_007232 [Curvularia kusanoi]|uniref:Uncharacterized protein n=1 Tax=Curvularia kusanoi TaxID=90978 RepID=A0A9P4W6R9_CURKU|nr:hypothetical protein E8E13_007232 [Curvularia kusanoi]
MALTWSRLLVILNAGIIFFSLTLVALSPAIIYLTADGSKKMIQLWPEGLYQWYRGPGSAAEMKPFIQLYYDSTNEHMIYATAAVSILAGLAGIAGIFRMSKTSKPLFRGSTLVLQAIPGTIALIINLIGFTFTQVVYDTHNKGKCYWENGYYAGTVFKCTPEQTACDGITGLFLWNQDHPQFTHYNTSQMWDVKRESCGEAQTGRHLMAPLFVASVLMCAFAVGKVIVERRKSRFSETADERVDRLARQGE